MATADMFNELEYYRDYRLAKDEIDLRSYLLDGDVDAKIGSGAYPTLAVLSRLQRTKGQGPRDPRARGVPPFPPRRRKEEIFAEDRYKEKDEYVKQQLPSPQDTEQSFIARLFKKCSSNLDKARAAFYFVGTARVDDLAEQSGESNIYSAIRNMRRERSATSICERLLRGADVPVQTIFGTKKGAGYENGHSTGRRGGNWMACYVEGEWRFIDAFWGSQSVAGFDTGNFAQVDDSGNVGLARQSEGRTVYSCDEYYFLTDPDRLIQSHFPVEEQRQWQLLARPLSFAEFQQMPFFFESYRSSNDDFSLMPKTHPLNVIVGAPGNIDIYLKETSHEMYDYSTTISIHKDSINSQTRDAIREQSSVKGYLSKVSRMGDGEVKFKFVPPCRGKFLLQIFVQKTADGCTQSAEFVSYTIHCPQADQNAQELSQGSDQLDHFGPGPQLLKVGLRTNEPGEMTAPDGERLIIFESALQSYRQEMLNCILMGAASERLPMSNVLIWMIGGQIFILFLSPDSGSFALVVQQRETPVCQFLVDAPSEYRDAGDFAIPDLDKLGGLGFLDDELNGFIQPDSHKQPYVKCEEPNLELKFTLKLRMEIEAELLLIDSNGQYEKSEGMTFVNGSMLGFVVDVRFRQAGHYVVRLKARLERSDSWRHYGNYFVRSLGELDGRAERFPDRLEAWGCDHRLVEPRQKLLPLNQKVKFRIKIEGAKVAYLVNEAIAGGQQRSLMLQDDSGYWTGSVTGYKGAAGKAVKIIAGEDKNKCDDLLLGYQFECKEDQNIRNIAQREAEDLNKRRSDNETRRLRKQENHERAAHALALLPADPIEEERKRLAEEQAAEQRRLALEEQRREEEKLRRRKEEEDRRRREQEKQKREEKRKKMEEEEEMRREAEAKRQQEEKRRRELEDKRRREEENQRRKKESAAMSRAQTRQEIKRGMEEAETRRKAEKREKRQLKAARRSEQAESKTQTAKAKQRKERLRDQLALSLHRGGGDKSLDLDKLVQKLREEDCDSEDEALLLFSARTREATEYKRELEAEMRSCRRDKNTSGLRSLVDEIKAKSYSDVVMSRIQPEYSQAVEELNRQARQQSISQRTAQQSQKPELNQRSLAELSGRKVASPDTHTIVQAALLLMGHCEIETQSWKRARTALKRSAGQLNSQQADKIKPAIAARAQQLLDSVKNSTAGIAASLSDWVNEMAAAALGSGKGGSSKCQPAVGKQQLKLLGVSSQEVEDWQADDETRIF